MTKAIMCRNYFLHKKKCNFGEKRTKICAKSGEKLRLTTKFGKIAHFFVRFSQNLHKNLCKIVRKFAFNHEIWENRTFFCAIFPKTAQKFVQNQMSLLVAL